MACSIRPTLSSFRFSTVASRSLSRPFLRLPSITTRALGESNRLRATRMVRRDGNFMRVMASQASTAASPENTLEWVKQDKRRMLHVVYRVGDLDRTIKFYTECLGMKLLRKRDIPEERYTNAFLGYGPEDSHFVIELTY
ncbi:hypothetical protein HN51_035775, partial [Arachis hypogaea]